MILITGYKGFIGSTLYERLLKLNYEVKVFEWGDELRLDNVNTVIHLGAISTTTETNVEKIMEQNYDFSVKLLDECIKRKINFQYASSASVYGLKTEFKENSPVDPKTPYAWSKYFFERYANQKINSDITIQGFRYFNVWGETGEEKKFQPSPYFKFKKQAIEKGIIEVFENSELYRRDFINVNEIVDLHLKFLNIKESGIWNFGTGEAKSFLEIAQIISEKYNSLIKYIPMPKILKESYQLYTCADMTKTKETLKLWSQYEKDFDNGVTRFG